MVAIWSQPLCVQYPYVYAFMSTWEKELYVCKHLVQ